MGRPYFRGVILRDHGTERPEGLPTMGTAPKTQKLTRCKKKAMTSEGLFRRLAHSILAIIDRDTRQSRTTTDSIAYTIASKKRKGADTRQTRKLARVISSGPRAEGVGHSPPSPEKRALKFRSGCAKQSQLQSLVADCVNSSPPLILRKFQGFGGIWANSGKFRDKVRGTQWNAMGFCMALSMNSVGIPGGFRGNAGFSGIFVVWGGFGWFGGGQKAFAQIANR